MRSGRAARLRLDPDALPRTLRRLVRPAVSMRLVATLAVGALVAGPVAAGTVKQVPGRQPSQALAAGPATTQAPAGDTLAPPSSAPVRAPRTSGTVPNPAEVSVRWSGAGALGIPTVVLEAYQHAAGLTATGDPGCNLGWWVLAGIGHIESGQAEGGRVDAHGTTQGRILGPRLDGHLAGNAVIGDTDHGALDGDPLYDRAVGPLQFIPSTWRQWGVDGNGDGVADPNNVFDAALTAAHYLCAGGRNLAAPAGLRAAILSYNDSAAYLADVLAWAQAYRVGAFAVPDSSAPVVTDVTAVRPPLTARPPVILLPRPPSSAPGTTAPRPVPRSTTPSASPPPSRGPAPSSSAGCATTPSSTASSTSTPAPPTAAASSSAAPASSSAAPSATAPAGTASASASPSTSATPRCP